MQGPRLCGDPGGGHSPCHARSVSAVSIETATERLHLAVGGGVGHMRHQLREVGADLVLRRRQPPVVGQAVQRLARAVARLLRVPHHARPHPSPNPSPSPGPDPAQLQRTVRAPCPSTCACALHVCSMCAPCVPHHPGRHAPPCNPARGAPSRGAAPCPRRPWLCPRTRAPSSGCTRHP